MNETTGTPSRRGLLKWLARGFLSLWAVGFAWVVSAFLKPPRSAGSLAERVIRVGPTGDLEVGQAKLVRHGSEPIFVVRVDESNLVALSGICTHLRCVLQWSDSEGTLNCPCHNGAFDLNGNVVKGPPPRPLTRYRVETQLGQIYVHL